MATPISHDQNGSAAPITLDSVARTLPARPASGHKGTFGQVILVAGSQLTPGAAILCSLGALYSGVGLVRWATDIHTVHMAPVRPPELMLALRDAPRLDAGAWADADRTAPSYMDPKAWAKHLLDYGGAIVVGPGLGQSPDAQAVVAALVGAADRPLCVDADALNILALCPGLSSKLPERSILTPHPKEMARLTGHAVADILKQPGSSAQALAVKTGCIVMLKAAAISIAAPDGQVVQTDSAGISALGHGGTGDVLCGLVGGLLAQGLDPFLAAQAAAVVHRAAGEAAALRYSATATTASGVACALADVWLSLGR